MFEVLKRVESTQEEEADFKTRQNCFAVRPHTNDVAVGFDEGVVVIKLGCDEPALSMDPANKLVYTHNTDVLSVNLQAAVDIETPEGQRIHLPATLTLLPKLRRRDCSYHPRCRGGDEVEGRQRPRAGLWRFDLTRECFERAGNLSALMLLAIGDRAGLAKLAVLAEKGQNNLVLASRLQLGDKEACVNLLVKTECAPQTVLFARTYAPSLASKAVDAWCAELTSKDRKKHAATAASPTENLENAHRKVDRNGVWGAGLLVFVMVFIVAFFVF
ncbi:hypothetical protein DFH11DRAFT_1751260 [Phellopilus nigrolimitatus]|nr:hypothetical protein DFH11DRAFT_1751260 [Phellopilus nigrolimitatus]